MLEIKNLTITSKTTTLVENLTITIDLGQWFALVGESGSGKSLTASAIGGLLPDHLEIKSGFIRVGNHEPLTMKKRELSRLLGNDIAYIFQDYNGAFTPFLTIGAQLEEVLKAHTKWPRAERRKAVQEGLRKVKLPEKVYQSYPLQLSGGQLQRAAIASAMLLNPSLLIADEPTTALDGLTAHHILHLIHELAAECAVLFITHDLRLVKKYATEIGVLKEGTLVETGPKEVLFTTPKHSYTNMLLRSIPDLKNAPERLIACEYDAL
ncbi:ATP-binding cassette domain-containing protein [Bacillus hwajinpoensis]|uniref:ATP-binding cassette domain-containing protein n=1 Tax=Guptibacillus hwajinpoensis TaxID=208199 RepID=A0A845F0Y3_9BACL|nr:ABC transporter ATP-binding protein [Pseudalkalibacillus hwajinpoensis]MYL64404.1 ATP-binding cassette domain-containing protein [Pseudalkalibacillus hwajinpoensis]